MPEESLTYRSSGVDVETANRAKERIKAIVGRTHTNRVLTRAGLFGGAVSLRDFQYLEKPFLTGWLGFIADEAEAEPEAEAAELAGRCLSAVASGAQPLAFLNYIAAARLDAAKVEALLSGFAGRLAAPSRIPIIGGETAQMPGVLRSDAWEVVAALFGVLEQQVQGWGCADLSRIRSLSHPALVFSMDGVGTKTRLGVMAAKTDGLALDIIHHSLNDILCQGAEGLALLYYVGCHARNERILGPFLRQVEESRERLGLETLELCVAEKPEAYLPGEVDICAAVAGLVDAGRLIQGDAVRGAESLIGLPSSGLHTNGYSLARKALLEKGGLALDQYLPELGGTLAEALLAPHKNYAAFVLPLLRDERLTGAIRGIAHITGGGLQDNLARILPKGLGAEIRLCSWQVPPLFRLIQRCGRIPELDPAGKGMWETFNMGIGMVLVADSGRSDELVRRLRAAGEEAILIGQVIPLPEKATVAKVHLLP